MRFLIRHKLVAAVFLLALINTIVLIYPNYRYECADNACGLSMVDTYFHDAFWHISIAASSFSTYPFRMPIFSGSNLQGYHYIYDLMLWMLGKIGFSYMFLYWRLSPLLYIVLITFLVIRFGRKLFDSSVFVAILLFFVYFAGTFSYIANLIMKGSAFGYGVSSLIHTSTSALYPTVAYSYCMIFAVMTVLLQKKMTFRSHIVLGVLLFVTMGLKFYAGVAIFVMLLVYEISVCVKQFLQSKQKISYRLHFINTTVLALLIYSLFFVLALVVFYEFPRALQHESVFSFAPLATVHPIIEDPYIYGMPKLVLARATLYNHGMSPRLLAIESFTIVLFLFHNFGTRIVGLVYLSWLLIRKKAKLLDIAWFVTILVTTVLSMVLVQRGEQWWNSIQFLYYAALLSSVYTARFLYELYKSQKKIAYVLVGLIILLTIPNSIEKVSEMYKTKKRAVSYAELQALSYLKKQPDGAVFSIPLMPDTAYISALTDKQTYFSDEEMLRNTGVAFEKRKQYLLKPDDLDFNAVKSRYVYLVKSDKLYPLFLRKAKESSYTKIFENKEVIVLARRK